ncbi:cell division protein FtsQ/DivIB [Fructilactobacillus frigidiflavus]|uniref:cell division protein FtsQ/DivIB n=1 Tax=Fructilactobacillus frigidiflavus TaxID=3242688 RepID=UPI0037563900
MKEDQQFSNDPVENEHLQQYIEKKVKRNSRLRVGRKNQKIKKSRRQRILKTVLPLGLFFLVVALISGYFVSPLSKVKTITIHASQNQKQLRKTLPIQVGDSLAMIKNHEAKINELVQQKNFDVKNVNINWKKHNEAIVKVNFYKFHAYVVDGKHYYAANARGEISKNPTKPINSGNLVLLYDFAKGQQVKTVLQQYDQLPVDLKNNIKEIKNEANADDQQKVKIILQDGNQVILKSSQLAAKMAYYPSIKTTLKRPSVVNLEYGAYATPIK